MEVEQKGVHCLIGEAGGYIVEEGGEQFEKKEVSYLHISVNIYCQVWLRCDREIDVLFVLTPARTSGIHYGLHRIHVPLAC